MTSLRRAQALLLRHADAIADFERRVRVAVERLGELGAIGDDAGIDSYLESLPDNVLEAIAANGPEDLHALSDDELEALVAGRSLGAGQASAEPTPGASDSAS